MTFKLKIFFPPQGELACLEREREKVIATDERHAAYCASLVRQIDERIAELRAKQTQHEEIDVA